MASITHEQERVLRWYVESDAALLVTTKLGNGLIALNAGGTKMSCTPWWTIEEMEALGFLRKAEGSSYTLTDDGRAAYELTPPPSPDDPIGFEGPGA